MLTIENKSHGLFYVTENGITYAVGAKSAAELLDCTVEEVKKIMIATVEVSQ